MKKVYQTFKGLCIFIILTFSSATVFAEKDTVTNTNNSGLGSLAAAIDSCNARVGLDTIVFAMTEGQSMTISLTASLPTITEGVFIDGYSQALSSPGPIASRTIRININAAGMLSGDIFTINAASVTIAGLAIYGSPGSAINILNNGNAAFIWGNYIGADSTGNNIGLGNFSNGVVANNGNFTNVSNIIVGTNGDATNDANEGNLISRNGNDGVLLWQCINSRIAGNIIGFNKNGTGSGFGNNRNGVLLTVTSSGNFVGTNGDGISDNLEGNLVGNNAGRGIFIAGASNINNVVAGNTVGLDATNAAAGNGTNGIQIWNGSNNRIGTNGNGTSDALERNIVCSNTGDGIVIMADDFFGFNSNSNSNTVAGNSVGTDAGGTLVRGNTEDGVFLFAGFGLNTQNNIIGTNYDGSGDAIEGNTIAFNKKGIVTNTPTGGSILDGNKFARNSIHDNTRLGIDLADDDVTANDNGDVDAGPNDLYNFPVIVSAQIDAGNNLIITGFAPPGAVVEFYEAEAGPNPFPIPPTYSRDFGEGQTYLFRAQEGGSLNGINDDSATTGTYSGYTEGTNTGAPRTENKFGFSVPIASLPIAVNSGTRIASLAYVNATGAGNTSEFGGVQAASIIPVTLTSFKGRLNSNKVYLTWTTAEEFNNSHFDIERSSNGTTYQDIGSVAGRGGRNNEYNFIDNGPLTKVNYYRLKQVDIDGKSTYSRVLILRGDLGKIAGKISPNPFTSAINISYQLEKEEVVHISLFDLMGRTVRTYTVKGNTGINTVNLGDLGNLPSGNYTIALKGETVSFKQQVVKQ